MKVVGGQKVANAGDLVWALGEARAWAQRGYAAFVKATDDSIRGVEVRRREGRLTVIPTTPPPPWLPQANTVITEHGEERTA